MKLSFLTLATLLVLAFSIGHGDPTPAPANSSASKAIATDNSSAKSLDTLDLKRVNSEYGDGNFETVVQILEDFRSKHATYRLRDSVLIAKYLGVVYASNPDAKEKGKYWLYKMLEKDPSEDLVDLYVGEEVDRTFEKVRQEFIMRRKYRGVNDVKLANSVQSDDVAKRDTVVRRDTIVVKQSNWVAPITDGIKDGLSEVKGGIKAGIKGGYVAVKEEPVTPKSSKWTGNINLGTGIKFLGQEWEKTGFSDETEFRFAFDIRQRGWPINIAVDLIFDQSPEVPYDFEAQGLGTPAVKLVNYEFNVGVRKIVDFKLYSVRPFYGGGFGRLTAYRLFDGPLYTDSFNDGHISIWANGGVYWELGRHFNIGLEYLYSWAKFDLFGTRNHGGSHFDMVAGFHF